MENKYENILRISMDGFLIVDLEGHFLDVNAAYCDLIGYNRDELFSMSISDVETIETEKQVKNHLKKCMENGSARFETVHKTKRGGEIHVEVSTNYMEEDKEFFVFLRDISERKQAENSLRESENFTRFIMDNLPIGIAVNSVDPEINFSYINDNFPILYRTTKEKLANPDTFWDVVYEDPDFRNEIKKKVLDDIASGDPDQMYWVDVPITRDGEETKYVTAKDIPIPQKELVLSTVWDSTERKRGEEDLHRSAILLESSIESPKDMIIFSLDCDYRYLYFNKGHADEMKNIYNSIPRLGDRIFDHMKGNDDIEKVKEHYDRALEGTGHSIIEEYCENPRRSYYEIQYNPIYDKENKIIGITVFARNVTERLQTDFKRQESEMRFRSIIENTDAGYFYIDEKGKYQDVNDAWVKMYKYTSADEIIGKHFTEVQHVEDIEKAKIFVTGIINKDKKYEKGEFSRKCKDGTIGYHTFSAKAVIKENRVIGIEGFIIDTTERHRMEEEHKRSLSEKELLLREAHHRVKNNLAIISSLINLHSRNEKNAENRKKIEELSNQIKSIRKVHEKLNQSKDISSVNFEEYVTDIVDSLFSGYGNKEVKIEIDIQEIFMAAAASISLGLMLNELTANAIKYGFRTDGPQKFLVRMKQDKNKENYILKVLNTGGSLSG